MNHEQSRSVSKSDRNSAPAVYKLSYSVASVTLLTDTLFLSECEVERGSGVQQTTYTTALRSRHLRHIYAYILLYMNNVTDIRVITLERVYTNGSSRTSWQDLEITKNTTYIHYLEAIKTRKHKDITTNNSASTYEMRGAHVCTDKEQRREESQERVGFAAALAVLVTGASQSRQHESHHRFFPVDTSLIQIESRKPPYQELCLNVGSRRFHLHSGILKISTLMFLQLSQDNA
ncbi:hypothetical protein Tco_0954906 [Tanacetum coccineum]|uniref:Uncharacterized protein n=1 Tax=Tanacetum coccineum TaxID=301880 RepID=A0ABQ5E5Q0_9ASTR